MAATLALGAMGWLPGPVSGQGLATAPLANGAPAADRPVEPPEIERGQHSPLDLRLITAAQAARAGDLTECEPLVAEARPVSRHDLRTRMALHALELACVVARAGPALQAADIEAYFAQVSDELVPRSHRLPPVGVRLYRLLDVRLTQDLWQELQADGFGGRAAELMQRWWQQQLDAALATEDDATTAARRAAATRLIDHAISGNYGFRSRVADMATELGWLQARLPPGHRWRVRQLRALAFGWRLNGRPVEALQWADRMRAELDLQAVPDVPLAIAVASERAGCLAENGHLAEAIEEYRVWRDHDIAIGDLGNLARAYYNLAAVASALGDWDEVVRNTELSIATADRSNDAEAQAESRAVANLAWAARVRRGDPGALDALADHLRSRPISPDHNEAVWLLASRSLADPSSRPGDRQLALERLRELVPLISPPLSPEAAKLALAEAWEQRRPGSEDASVRPSLLRALSVTLGSPVHDLAAISDFALARSLAAEAPGQAIWAGKRGVNELQALRLQLPSEQREEQLAWFADYEPDLRRLVGQLIDTGRLVEARQAIAFLRGEELQDYTRRARGRTAVQDRSLSYTPAESALNAQLEPLTAEVARVSHEAAEVASAKGKQQYTSGRRELAPRYAPVWQDWGERLGTALQTLPADAGHEGGTHPTAASPAALPSGTAGLAYFVREGQTDLLLQTRHGLRHLALPVGQAELSRAVQALRTTVASPERDPRAAARQLWDWLIAPVAATLEAERVRRLSINVDGVLRYVPFAALHDGRGWLVQRWATGFAAGTDGAPPTPAPGPVQTRVSGAAAPAVLALGRTRPDPQHTALPGVARELATLQAAGARTLLDEAFTESSLRQGLQTHPAVVHLASHFVLDPAGEDQSYLLLGDGQHLSLSALRQLPWTGVQLALVSACESALPVGDRRASGREIAGVAGALQQAGVPHLVATLWPISDEVTPDWMQRFYAPWRTAARSAAAHGARGPVLDAGLLADAQRAWLREHPGQALAHPHYWAAFAWYDTGVRPAPLPADHRPATVARAQGGER